MDPGRVDIFGTTCTLGLKHTRVGSGRPQSTHHCQQISRSSQQPKILVRVSDYCNLRRLVTDCTFSTMTRFCGYLYAILDKLLCPGNRKMSTCRAPRRPVRKVERVSACDHGSPPRGARDLHGSSGTYREPGSKVRTSTPDPYPNLAPSSECPTEAALK